MAAQAVSSFEKQEVRSSDRILIRLDHSSRVAAVLGQPSCVYLARHPSSFLLPLLLLDRKEKEASRRETSVYSHSNSWRAFKTFGADFLPELTLHRNGGASSLGSRIARHGHYSDNKLVERAYFRSASFDSAWIEESCRFKGKCQIDRRRKKGNFCSLGKNEEKWSRFEKAESESNLLKLDRYTA